MPCNSNERKNVNRGRRKLSGPLSLLWRGGCIPRAQRQKCIKQPLANLKIKGDNDVCFDEQQKMEYIYNNFQQKYIIEKIQSK